MGRRRRLVGMRKAMGIKVLLLLGVLFVMVVAVKKAIWRNVHH